METWHRTTEEEEEEEELLLLELLPNLEGERNTSLLFLLNFNDFRVWRAIGLTEEFTERGGWENKAALLEKLEEEEEGVVGR